MSLLRQLLFRQPGVGVLLLNYLVMNTGFYLLIPFIALHGTHDLGLSAALAGVVLGVRQFIQQGLALVGGVLGDRFGFKAALSAGLLIRALGFAAFAFATDLTGLLIAAMISAFGGAFFESSGNAALASLTPPENRATAFSLYGIASRLGSAIGPALGIWLISINFSTLSLVAASFYVVGFFLLLYGMPNTTPPSRRAEVASRPPPFREAMRKTLADRRFVQVVALNSGYWFLFVQFTISLPLYVYARFQGLEAIGAYYVINSIPAVVAQYVLLQYINRRLSRPRILALAMGLVALGMGTLGMWSSAWLVVVSASIYALGDLLYQPTQYTITSDLARPEMLAVYFGFAALALAVGGGIGNVLGGVLFDLATARGQPELVWYAYGLFGVIIAGGLLLWSKKAETAVL